MSESKVEQELTIVGNVKLSLVLEAIVKAHMQMLFELEPPKAEVVRREFQAWPESKDSIVFYRRNDYGQDGTLVESSDIRPNVLELLYERQQRSASSE